MDSFEIAQLSRRKVSLSMSIPIVIVTVIDRIAASENVGFTVVAERVLRKGLEVERNERAAKSVPKEIA